MHHRLSLVLALFFILSCTPSPVPVGGVTEFCLEGDLDLGVRYQGTSPAAGEFYPATWCVITEDDSHRVMYSASGKSNPDMNDSWTVAYLPPDHVRIVNRQSPPDIEFEGTDNPAEARRVRRVDPRRLMEEINSTQQTLDDMQLEIRDNRIVSINTVADLPLRGTVEVIWRYDWTDPSRPQLRLILDGDLLFRATGRWRVLPDAEAATLWAATPGAESVKVPGERWPSRINMRTLNLTDGVHLVRGVRTGFQHVVIATDEGLVVADAPAGWVEFHQLPPSDFMPGLGVSGLSERFVDYLAGEFPGKPVRAVALTHFHDDHAGGARAFAAAGATIYATEQSSGFFEKALNRPSMPEDRYSKTGSEVVVLPVTESVTIGSEPNRVRFVSMGPSPHVYAMLGVWAVDKRYFFVSDVHVPRSDANSPRENRATTECWFAKWAVNNLPDDVRVANSHSEVITPVKRLAEYLKSEACLNTG